MKNPICISTGFVYKLSKDMNEKIGMLKNFFINGIELCFAYPEDLLSFVINQENIRYLRVLKFISIHSPWKEVIYGNNQKTKDILRTLEKLYKEIGAYNVVFHKEQIDDINIITNYDFTASIENGDWRESGNSVEEIKAILNKNKSLKFTLDFAHALTISSDDIPIYFNKFKDKLISIHLAMFNKNLKGHWFLHKYDSEEIRTLLNYFKNTNVPIVLECVASGQSEIQLIKKEIEYIKTI